VHSSRPYLHREVYTLLIGHGVISLIFVAGDITTPEAFLKAIGRGSETKITFETWDSLWKANGLSLKKAGVAVRDRRYVLLTYVGATRKRLYRYILWAMERYRRQEEPSDYAHEAKPKKKIRGCVDSSASEE
jgi:hypothetical protein